MADEEAAFADFDDDIFINHDKEVKHYFLPEYDAKIETDGWFQDYDSMKSVMLEHCGPKQIKSAIEHDYLYKRYERALSRTLDYIHVVETVPECKVSNLREIAEIGVHCAARLGQYDCVESLLDRKQTTIELGTLLLKGRFYALCKGRQGDALHALVEYSQIRSNDYAAWTQMAVVCQQDWPDLALLLTNYALRVILAGQNKTIRKDYLEHGITRLQELRDSLLERKADVAVFVAWMENADATTPTEYPFAKDDLEWILSKWIHQGQEEGESSQERAARDL